jgi:MFS family permease
MQLTQNKAAGVTTRGVAEPAVPMVCRGLLVAALPFADFAQAGFTAFAANSIMGSLGASPEEFSGVTLVYAVVAICAIALQRAAVERFGTRRMLQVVSLLWIAGAAVCATSGSLGQFAAGRMLMAAGSAPALAAARVLVLELFAAPQRPVAIRFLPAGIAWGVATGPLLGGWAFGPGNWHTGFALLAMAPAAVALLAGFVVPAGEQPQRRFGARDALSLGLLALGGGALVWSLLQAGFNFFDQPLWLVAVTGMALLPLGGFALLQADAAHPPLVRLGVLRHPRIAGGLGIFGAAYLVLGASNMMLPLLLQRVLLVPQETAGFWLGAGSLAGVAAWIAMARLLPRRPGPLPYYAAGLLALLSSALLLERLSEASPPASVLPALALYSACIIIMLSVTATRTFHPVQDDAAALTHANQAKNMVAQVALATGTTGATLLLQARSTQHFSRLVEGLTATNGGWDATVGALRSVFGQDAPTQVIAAQVGQWLTQEAVFLATLDYFRLLAIVAATALLIVSSQAATRLGRTATRS